MRNTVLYFQVFWQTKQFCFDNKVNKKKTKQSKLSYALINSSKRVATFWKCYSVYCIYIVNIKIQWQFHLYSVIFLEWKQKTISIFWKTGFAQKSQFILNLLFVFYIWTPNVKTRFTISYQKRCCWRKFKNVYYPK